MIKSQLEHSVAIYNSRETEQPSALNERGVADINESAYVLMTTTNYLVDEQRATSKDEQEKHTGKFSRSRKEEIKGLVENRTSKMVNINGNEKGTRLLGSRFINLSKPIEIGIRYKSRQVAQNYGDMDSATITAEAQTVGRLAQRLVPSLASSLDSNSTRARDITLAYT